MARALIRRFDELVRRILGVVEFTSDPDCLLRIRLARLPHPVEIGRARLPAGAPASAGTRKPSASGGRL